MKAIFDLLRSKRWLRNSLIGAGAFLFVVAVAGFFVAPPILKNVLAKSLSETLHRPAAIREIAVNPFALSVSIRGFVLKDRNGTDPFLSFEELYLNLGIATLFRGGPIFKEVRLERPFLHIARTTANTYSFSDLIEEFASKRDEAGRKPVRFSLNNIRLRGGSVEFRDVPKGRVHKVTEIELSVPFLSNIPYYVNRYVQPYFAARVNGTPVDLRGKTKPFAESRETSFDIDIRRFDIPAYVEYIPARLGFNIPSAFLDVIGKLTFTQYRDRPPTLGYSGKVAVRDVKVTERGGADLLAFPLFDVDVAASDVSSRRVALSRVLLQSPVVSVRRDKSGILNVQSLYGASAPVKGRGKEPPQARAQETGGPAWTLTADSIRIAGGRAEFRDLAASAPFRTTLDPVNLDVRHFTNVPDGRTEADFSLRTEAAESVAVKGTFSVDPPASEGAVEIAGARLKKYAPYYAKSVLFTVEDGTLDLKTRYAAAEAGKKLEVILSDLETHLKSLRLRKAGEKEDFLSMPAFSVRNVRIDLAGREAIIGEVSSRGGRAAVVRPRGGNWNVAALFPEEPAAAGGEPPGPKARKEGNKAKEARWQVRLGKLDIDRYDVRYEDRVPPDPVSLAVRGVSLKGESISTRKDAVGKAALGLRVGNKGSVSARGTVSLNPVGANLKVAVKEFDIVPLQPYFTEKVKILVTGGKASAEGTLALESPPAGGVKVAYAGTAALSGFSSVDKVFSDDFLKWDSLSLAGIDAGYNPTRVSVEGIALTDFYSRLIVESNGTFNVQGIVGNAAAENAPDNDARASATAPAASAGSAPERGEAQGPAAGSPPAPVPVTIGLVTLQGGSVYFSDRYTKPGYSATLTEFGGRVSGLSSEETRMADVALRGKLGTGAPLEVSGKINPLGSDLFVDLNVAFKDIDLSPMTPYAGKYLGYTIQKGKLTLNLRYFIEKKKLDATNKIFIDQFTFGDRVESPDATKLPVTLAVALLKNRAGEIELDVPVSGRIDDPKFSVFRIVLKILGNLLVKAATSPFALLGAIFGGGEELSYLEFEPGSFRVDGAGEGKLATLVKALHDRPGLKVEIEGHVDPEKDPEGLRQSLFLKKVKAQKLKDMTAKGIPPVPVDNVTVSPEEYPGYLKAAYKAEKFPKPRNVIGFAKDLPGPEMEKLILTHIEVKPDDLRGLAMARSQAVEELVLKSGKVEPERIFLVEPKSLPAEKKEKVRESRVDFRLK